MPSNTTNPTDINIAPDAMATDQQISDFTNQKAPSFERTSVPQNQSEQELLNEAISKYGPVSSNEPEPKLSTDEQSQISKDAETEKYLADKYDNQNIEAAALGAARGLTFGVSDQILKRIVGKEALKELKDRNKLASITGEIAGTIAPLALSGGTGILAKGAETVGAGVIGASEAGLAMESLTSKALQKLLTETGSKRIVNKIISKGVSAGVAGATEGGLYGVGQLISEDALGDSELTGEHIMSSFGTGALLGGAVGGLVGAIPGAAKAAAAEGKSVFQKVLNKTKLADPEQAAVELVGISPASHVKLNHTAPDVVNELPTFLAEKAGAKNLKDTDNLYKVMHDLHDESGSALGNLYEHEMTPKVNGSIINDVQPTRGELYSDISKSYDNMIQEYKDIPEMKSKVSDLIRTRDEYMTLAFKNPSEQMTAKEVHDLMVKIQKAAKYDKIPGTRTLAEDGAAAARSVLRNHLDTVATKLEDVGKTDLASRLKSLNKDYRITSTILPYLEKKANKATKIGSLTDFMTLMMTIPGGVSLSAGVLGAKKFLESDLRRSMVVMKYAAEQAEKNNAKIKKSVETFISGKRVATPTVTKALLVSPLSLSTKEGKKQEAPRSEKEAFKNMSENINKLASDPEQLLNNIAKGTFTVAKVAPKSANYAAQTAMTALQFLKQKMPTSRTANQSIEQFSREYSPSSLELAKFSRYVETVENPMSALDDLQAGTLTREQVETLQTVFPKIYGQIQSAAMDSVSNQDTKLSYNQKVQLGVLLNIPTDPSLSAQSIQQLQSQFAQPANDQQASAVPAGKVVSTGMQKADFSGRSMTQSQRISSRS